MKTGRPKLHQAKRLSVSISLTADELRAASPDNQFGGASVAEQVAACVRVGAAARARAQRIGTEGYEISKAPDALELLIRTNTAHGARVLHYIIRAYEDLMRQDFTHPTSGFGEVPTTNWALALTEIRSLVEAHGGHDVVMQDTEGRSCRIEFFKTGSELQ